MVSAVSKWSEVAEKSRLHLGGWGGLVFGGRLVLGGGGYAMLRSVELPGSEASSGFNLGMGYGGIYLGYLWPIREKVTGGLSILAGGGHAEVRDQRVGREVGADNFVVAEPGLYLSYAVLPKLHLGASGGYRAVWGVDDLPRVTADELEAPTFSLSLRLGGR